MSIVATALCVSAGLYIVPEPPEGWEDRLIPGYDPPIERVLVEHGQKIETTGGDFEDAWAKWDEDAVGHLFLILANDRWSQLERHVLDILADCPYESVCERLAAELRHELLEDRGRVRREMYDDKWWLLIEATLSRCPEQARQVLIEVSEHARAKRQFQLIDCLRSFESDDTEAAAWRVWQNLAADESAVYRHDAYRQLYTWNRPNRRALLDDLLASFTELRRIEISDEDTFVDSMVRAMESTDGSGRAPWPHDSGMHTNHFEFRIEFEGLNVADRVKQPDYPEDEAEREAMERRIARVQEMLEREFGPDYSSPFTQRRFEDMADLRGEESIPLFQEMVEDSDASRDKRMLGLMMLVRVGTDESLDIVRGIFEEARKMRNAPEPQEKYTYAEKMRESIWLMFTWLGYGDDLPRISLNTARVSEDYEHGTIIHSWWHYEFKVFGLREIDGEWYPSAIVTGGVT